MHEPLTEANRPTSTRGGLVVNVAHRGASAEAPENTLSAVRTALSRGADMIELDVQRCRDGALVVLHDRTLTRTTNVRHVYPSRAPWRVADFTLDELRRLDAGSWKAPVWAGETIPTLEDVMEALRESRAGLLVDLKAPQLYPGIVSDLVATIRQVPAYTAPATAAGRLVVQARNVAAMKDLQTQDPSLRVGLVGAPATANLPVLATWVNQINPGHLVVNRRYVDHVHALGMECLVWTVNHTTAMNRALRMGVDGVITNRPDLLGQLIRGRPTLLPRLLADLAGRTRGLTERR